MPDTVRFQLPGVSPPTRQLDNMGYVTSPPTDEGMIWHKYFLDIDGPRGSKIHFTYYPQDIFLNPSIMTLIECSLPKLVFGNNVEVLTNIGKAVQILEPIVGDFVKKKVNLFTSELDRIDFSHNFYVDGHVTAWIDYLFKLELPKRETKPFYPTNGVQYFSKYATLIFYDKFKQSGLSIAKGILREEASYIKKYSVRRVMGDPKKPVFITDITPNVEASILRKENERLGINNKVVADPSIALKTLLNKYGSEQGIRLFGHLMAINTTDGKEIMKSTIHKQTLWRSKDMIKKAGLCPGFSNHLSKLPVLSIPLPSDAEIPSL